MRNIKFSQQTYLAFCGIRKKIKNKTKMKKQQQQENLLILLPTATKNLKIIRRKTG